MKNFIYSLFWGFIVIVTFGKIKNAVSQSMGLSAVLSKLYNSGGIWALLIPLIVPALAYWFDSMGYTNASGLVLCLWPFSIIAMAFLPDKTKTTQKP